MVTKKALSVAVRYYSLSQQWPEHKWLKLKNTHKDLTIIHKLLTTKYGYEEDNIKTLVDDNPESLRDPSRLPTKQNIYNAIDELVQGSKEGDHLVFHFSGHGSQKKAIHDSGEVDGFDELFWPSDIVLEENENGELEAHNNYMLDDDLKVKLVDNLPEGVRLTVIFDACHSGTGLDLPFQSAISLPSSPLIESCNLNAFYNYPSHDYISAQGIGKGMRLGIRGTRHMGSINLTYDAHLVEGEGNTTENAVTSQLHVKPNPHKPCNNSPLVTSWAACSDDQLEFESEGGDGGAFVNILSQILLNYGTSSPTQRDVLRELTKGLRVNAKEIKRKVTLKMNEAERRGNHERANKLRTLLEEHKDTQSKPVFSSLVKPEEILDRPFML